MGLRIRQKNQKFEQTLKTQDPQASGLTVRQEYDAPLSQAHLDLSLIPAKVWPEHWSVAQLAQELRPWFSTDFVRHSWELADQLGNVFELVLDVGHIEANGQQVPIQEREVELKQGQASALLTCAKWLMSHYPLRIASSSKAQQGYALATAKPRLPVRPLALVPLSGQEALPEALSMIMTHAYHHWAHHEESYWEQPNREAYLELRTGAQLMHRACVLLVSMWPEQQPRVHLDELIEDLLWLLCQLNQSNAAQLVADFLKDEHLKEKKRKALQALMAVLPQQDDCYQQLLRTPRYRQLMLKLLSWVHNQPWQSAMSDAPKIEQQVPCWLESHWQQLTQVFMQSTQMTQAGYVQEALNLRSNLLLGTCFGTLYPKAEREKFRLPWVDLSQGCDALQAWQQLQGLTQEYAQQLPAEDVARLDKWSQKQVHNLLNIMEKTRQQARLQHPYWQDRLE